MVMLQPEGIEGLDSLECVLVEPMGKILSPSEYTSTGLIICLDGAAHDSETGEEWGEVLKSTKWLDSGISFALPDVSSLAEACDVELVLTAVLKQGNWKTCILVGKGWGGQMASEIAARPRLSERIDGVLLIAPGGQPPNECSQIEVPVMLIWAENDEESDFRDMRDWCEVLYERRAPFYPKDLDDGGHDFAKLMKQGDTAGQVLHFVVSCLLLGLLMRTLDETPLSSLKLSDAEEHLCHELPLFLATQIGGDPEQGVAAAMVSSDPSRIKRRMERLQKKLVDWIREGMQEMASATE